jgi:lysozyme
MLVDQLKRDEGVKLKPYRDSVGKLTIGVGRNLDDDGLTMAEVEMLLQNDIQQVQTQLQAALPWVYQLDEARRGALENMAFNLGVHGLLEFRNTLSLIERGKYDEAADGMLKSKWAAQVGPRATRLSQQMRTGEWV